MRKDRNIELGILKTILWIYITLCLIIAGLNYGYANKSNSNIAETITWFWHFYENWIKTIFIVICSFLTLRIVGNSQRIDMRKRNLIGFIIAASLVHIVGPLILHNKELYFFTMPLPWTTTPLQLLYPGSSFYLSRVLIWGTFGISVALIFYISYSIVIILGTLTFGRRWQCSTLCLFNGFASEVFSPAFPLIGRRKKVQKKTVKIFFILRWIALSISIFFTIYWIIFLLGISLPGDIHVISKIENYKYLTGELLMAMFFWIAFTGRGYCYYCPIGTLLGLIGKVAGQKITTDNTECISCNKCNLTCPMTIDIKEKAKRGQVVKDLNCVGCGHCVDICPTKTLSYSTKFLSRKKLK